jgi:peptidyl-tRNA hydrolase, PTH1 family
MKLIVGLGNPGREYDATRHNAGWWFVDHLAGVWHADAFRKDGQALATTVRVGDQPVRLVKPQTYMNQRARCTRRRAAPASAPPATCSCCR